MSIESRNAIPAIAVSLTGIAVVIVAWQALLEDRRGQLDAALQTSAADTAIALEDGLARQIRELKFLAQDWARDFETAPDSLQNRARRLTGLREGLESLTWIGSNPGTAPIGVAAAPGAALVPPKWPDEGLSGIRFRWLDPADDAAQTRRLAEFTLPVTQGTALLGYLVAKFDAGVLVGGLLEARATRYAIEIMPSEASGEPFYRRGTPAPLDAGTRDWRSEREVETPFGTKWRLTLVPTAEFAAARLGPLPDYLLAAGILLCIVLGLLVAVLRRSFVAVEAQAEANQLLRGRESELTLLAASLESRVAERTEELEDVVSELEAFNYSVSHDLRSPLGAILNFTSILEEDHGAELDDEVLKLLARIKGSATRATGLLEDLLALSRAGRAELDWERVDLMKLTQSAFAQAAAVEGAEDAALHIDPLPRVEVDAPLIETVLQNLFTNALKYSRGREKREIRVESKLDGDMLIVTVADNGRGFDMRYADKLFQVFERLHGDTEIEGNGVGLAIVARIVKRHGGRVWADAKPECGARFSFSLPVDQMNGNGDPS